LNNSIVAWLLGAIVLSWAMGAYNRLVRLRAKGLFAFLELEQALGQQMTLISTNFLEDAVVVDAAPTDWRSLLASAKTVNSALKQAYFQPLNGDAIRDLKDGIEAVGRYWRQLADLPPDLAGSFLPPSVQVQWEPLAFRVERAKTDFNKAVINYNEAKDQFPANLLAKIFGFKSAQPV
jgi:LemA protein